MFFSRGTFVLRSLLQAELKKHFQEEHLPDCIGKLEKLLRANKGGDGYFVGDEVSECACADLDAEGVRSAAVRWGHAQCARVDLGGGGEGVRPENPWPCKTALRFGPPVQIHCLPRTAHATQDGLALGAMKRSLREQRVNLKNMSRAHTSHDASGSGCLYFQNPSNFNTGNSRGEKDTTTILTPARTSFKMPRQAF